MLYWGVSLDPFRTAGLDGHRSNSTRGGAHIVPVYRRDSPKRSGVTVFGPPHAGDDGMPRGPIGGFVNARSFTYTLELQAIHLVAHPGPRLGLRLEFTMESG